MWVFDYVEKGAKQRNCKWIVIAFLPNNLEKKIMRPLQPLLVGFVWGQPEVPLEKPEEVVL